MTWRKRTAGYAVMAAVERSGHRACGRIVQVRNMLKITIEENDAGQRLDRFLRKYLRKAPLSSIYRIIRKDAKVNGRRVKEDRILHCGDELILYLSEEQVAGFAKATAPAKARRQFGIAFEDDHVLIVEKPSGLLTHGDRSEKKNTLANQVCGYLQQRGEYDPAREKVFRPSPVNRLDRNTSGLVMFGKNADATRQLTKMLRERGSVRKYYMTIVCGCFDEEQTIATTLAKDEKRNIVSVDEGKESVSIVKPLEVGDEFSLVEVELITGRTHQIRVHLAHIGHPLAADPKYGDPRINGKLRDRGLTTQFLHAWRLEFAEEVEAFGEVAALAGMTVEAKTPEKFAKAAALLVGSQDRG